MRFEARDLKSYATPVTPKSLEVGEIYFSVTYLDHDMLIPTVEPLVFIGRNLEVGDAAEVYFQDPESFRRGITFQAAHTEPNTAGDDAELDKRPEGLGRVHFYSAAQSDATNIFMYDDALDELLKCSLRRRDQAHRAPRGQ